MNRKFRRNFFLAFGVLFILLLVLIAHPIFYLVKTAWNDRNQIVSTPPGKINDASRLDETSVAKIWKIPANEKAAEEQLAALLQFARTNHLKAVSYTHLARERSVRCKVFAASRDFRSPRSSRWARSSSPVSYTHLDVYKRQALIIAEKPSVASDISKALGKFEKNADFYENDQYVISSAVGHLLTIAVPEQFRCV